MALLKGEGTHQILYGGADLFSGLRHNRGYMARPDHAGGFPAVVLAHGRPGITSSVKSLARRLARHGLVVVTPDLFRGVPRKPLPPWPNERRAVSDLLDAAQWAASADTPFVRSGSIGLVALGHGAQASLRVAAGLDPAGLALISPALEPTIDGPPCPIIGFYGRDDEVVPAAERQSVQAHFGQAEWVLYGGVGHGLVDEAAADYRWDVAEDVTDRIVAFFARVFES